MRMCVAMAPPEIAGQQDRAQKSCTRNRVKNRGDESECTNHSKMMLGVSELQCSFHYGSWLNKFENTVEEHKQNDKSAHDSRRPQPAF